MNEQRKAFESIFGEKWYDITRDKAGAYNSTATCYIWIGFQAAIASKQRDASTVAWMYQHDDTGRIGFVDQWQIENGFKKHNPQLKIISPLYIAPPEVAALQVRITELESEAEQLRMSWHNARIMPDGWKPVPIEPT